MAMTKTEYRAKSEIMRKLSEQGYPTYARLFSLFDLNITQDPEAIAYMIPGKAKIVVNGGLDIDQISVVVRHEILHEFLNHNLRMQKHYDATHGEGAWERRSGQTHNNSNIAGDYEISNRGYTDADKYTIRHIKLNDKVLSGLVTEDEHPDWVDLSIEEMFDKLEQQMEKEQEEMQQDLQHSQEYIDIYNKIIDMYDNDKYSDEDLRDLANKIATDPNFKL